MGGGCSSCGTDMAWGREDTVRHEGCIGCRWGIGGIRRPPPPVRVVLADDEALIRAGLALLLDAEPDLEVVGEAANGQECLSLSATVRPDVVVMDVRMPLLMYGMRSASFSFLSYSPDAKIAC